MTEIGEAARQRMGGYSESRAVCYSCGLREAATIHGDDWWQHEYEPGILTRNRRDKVTP